MAKNLKPTELYHKIAIFLKSHWLLFTILVLAFFFRFWMIKILPGGLFPDEAANGIDVNSILKGDLQPFYERGNGREALFFYILAIPVAIFGRGHWQHHIASAAIGFLAIIPTYLIAKRIFNKNTALISAFLMGISSYAVVLSRTAFRAITVPLFTTLTLYFLIRLYQEKGPKAKIISGLFAGISFGLGFYTYISFRMMIPLLGGLGIILLFGARGRIKSLIINYWKSAVAFITGFIICFGWLGYYFLTHPGSFIGRAGQVSIFNPDLNKGNLFGTFFEVFWLTIKGFFLSGDLNWRHNVSGAPFLDPFSSIFFALALIVFTTISFKTLWEAWKKNIQAKSFYLLIIAAWFWLMIVPEITTAEGIPHGLRLIGVIPPLFILPAWGIDRLWNKIKVQQTSHPEILMAIKIIFILMIFSYNFILYFGVAKSSSEYYYSFRSDLTTVSEYLNKRNLPEKTYLALDEFSVQTVKYFTTKTDHPYKLLVPEHTYRVELNPGDQVIFTMSTLYDRIKFTQAHPDAKLVYTAKNQFGEIIMLIYQKP